MSIQMRTNLTLPLDDPWDGDPRFTFQDRDAGGLDEVARHLVACGFEAKRIIDRGNFVFSIDIRPELPDGQKWWIYVQHGFRYIWKEGIRMGEKPQKRCRTATVLVAHDKHNGYVDTLTTMCNNRSCLFLAIETLSQVVLKLTHEPTDGEDFYNQLDALTGIGKKTVNQGSRKRKKRVKFHL
jgi:hypothetical protein